MAHLRHFMFGEDLGKNEIEWTLSQQPKCKQIVSVNVAVVLSLSQGSPSYTHLRHPSYPPLPPPFPATLLVTEVRHRYQVLRADEQGVCSVFAKDQDSPHAGCDWRSCCCWTRLKPSCVWRGTGWNRALGRFGEEGGTPKARLSRPDWPCFKVGNGMNPSNRPVTGKGEGGSHKTVSMDHKLRKKGEPTRFQTEACPQHPAVNSVCSRERFVFLFAWLFWCLFFFQQKTK